MFTQVNGMSGTRGEHKRKEQIAPRIAVAFTRSMVSSWQRSRRKSRTIFTDGAARIKLYLLSEEVPKVGQLIETSLGKGYTFLLYLLGFCNSYFKQMYIKNMMKMITVMIKAHLLFSSSLLFPPDELPPWLNIWSKAIKSQRGFPVIAYVL